MRTSRACGLTASRTVLPASRLPVERKSFFAAFHSGIQSVSGGQRNQSEHLSPRLTQLGGLPVPWLPWLPVRPGDGAFQELERLGSPPAPNPVHPQGEGHADAPQGLLRDDRIETRPARLWANRREWQGFGLASALTVPWKFFNSRLAAQANGF